MRPSDRAATLLEQLVDDDSLLQYDEPLNVEPGECRYCGCRHNDPCELDSPPYVCCWYRKPNHRGLGVCSHPECVKQYIADPGAP